MAGRAGIRQVHDGDRTAVNALLAEGGFKQRSAAGWSWLFEQNPALTPETPPGWVLERDGAVVGYLGNHPVRYAWGERELRAVTCSAWYVRSDARAQSTELLTAWFRQRGAQVFVSTTANEASGPAYGLFKAKRPRGASFGTAWIWVASDAAVLRYGARTRLPGAVAGLAPVAGVGGPMARLVRRVAGLGHAPRTRFHGTIDAIELSAVGRDFDLLWGTVRTQGGLRVWRDATALRWSLADPDTASPPVVLAARVRGQLVGYVAGRRHEGGAVDLPQLRVLDLVVHPEHTAAAPALIRGLVEQARALGLGLVYCAPGGEELAGLLEGTRPRVVTRPHGAHFIRTRRLKDLPDPAEGHWQATPLDGDIPFAMSDPGAP